MYYESSPGIPCIPGSSPTTIFIFFLIEIMCNCTYNIAKRRRRSIIASLLNIFVFVTFQSLVFLLIEEYSLFSPFYSISEEFLIFIKSFCTLSFNLICSLIFSIALIASTYFSAYILCLHSFFHLHFSSHHFHICTFPYLQSLF